MTKARGGPSDRLQDGIFFRRGQRPPPCWRLLLLDVAPATEPAEARAAIAAVLRMLGGLQSGNVRELRGQPQAAANATRETFRELTVLVGYGRSLFDPARHDPPLTASSRPDFLAYLPTRGDAFPTIPWAEGNVARGEADLALQITGVHAAGVNRAAVETWKLITERALPLSIVASVEGFGRPDGRGWLEFHDGVANMASSQRLDAIAARADPRWMGGGTYMAFLRLRVDLKVWGALDRGEQELIVGRDKLTGNPLIATRRDARGRARPMAPESRRPTRTQLAERAEAPQTSDPLIESSHVHRANQNRASPRAPAALRMFRQGYDFLDLIGPDGPDLGLNFVSFQSDLAVFQHVMHLPGWLGDVNFGGPAKPRSGAPPAPQLIALLGGGVYAVPRRARPFPGAGLFKRS